MTKIIGSILVIAFSSTQVLLAQSRLYVSPTGDDGNPGTQALPIRTLEHARDLVRTMDQNMDNNIIVLLAGGMYRLTEPLALDARDSGTGGHYVIYAPAEQGSPVVISGGVPVTGWKLVDSGKNLWSTPAPAGLKNTRQLYVNGVRAMRTQGRLPVTLAETATGYTASSDVMAGWRNPGDIEFVYTGGNDLWSERSSGLGSWTEPRCPVASIKGTNITMAQPCWDNSTRRVLLPPDFGSNQAANLVGPASVGRQPEYVENAYELLGTPGQWYFDRAAGVIYYVPRKGEDLKTADVEAPVLEKLISADGTESAPVHDIAFKGLQFSYATWLSPSSNEGFSEIKANYTVTGQDGYATQGLGDLAPNGRQPFGAWTKTPGNVSFSYAREILFIGDDFVHLGGAGLELGYGSQSNEVQGCVFTDISANGIELGGVDLPEAGDAQAVRDNQILDNHIYNVAAEFHGGVGIDVGYAQNTVIAHNQLDHLPYTAISMGWGGWPDKIKRPGIVNNSHDNRVEDNLIFDYLQLLCRGGGIYTQGQTGPSLADGEKLTGNVIYDQFSSGHGIYTDNGCDNVTATNNVIFHTDHDNWGVRHHDYYEGEGGDDDHFDFENNYWQQGDPDVAAGHVTLKNNRLISALNQAPPNIVRYAGVGPGFRNILDKRFASPVAPAPPMRVAVSAGNGLVLLAWSPPNSEGGAPIKSYTVISSKGDKETFPAGEFNTNAFVKFTGLSNDLANTFVVTADNARGSSPPSLPSASVVPSATAFQPPDAPSNVTVEAGNGIASIHITAPEKNGGSPVLSYAVTVKPGGRKVMFVGRKFLVLGGEHVTLDVVDGLENGKTYTFDVAAVNLAGEGAPKTAGPITTSNATE